MAIKKLMKRVESFLKDAGWTYEFDEARNAFHTGIELEAPLGPCPVVIGVDNERIECWAFFTKPVPEDKRTAAAEYLMRANYGQRMGAFMMGFAEGDVAYHSHVSCAGGTVPVDEVLRDLLFVPFLMLEQYGRGLVDVMEGRRTPAEAIAEVDIEGESSTSATA